VEELVHRPQAPAARALRAEDRPEEAGGIEAVGRRVEEEKDDCGNEKDQDTEPPPTPARTV
jgi:hypothetical protein